VVRVQVSAVAGERGYRRSAKTAWELVELHPLPAPRTLTVTVLGAEEAPIPSLPAVKSCSSLAHVLCAAAAERRGVDEAVRTAGGRLLEASASNLFWEARRRTSARGIGLESVLGSRRRTVHAFRYPSPVSRGDPLGRRAGSAPSRLDRARR
jgi:branched-subunit amino acid aminotransferase/4-amino-4-deoxychorismate lyase